MNKHAFDIWRLKVLMNYGGIYLNNDVYVVNPLYKYLKFELTVSWPDRNNFLGFHVLIAHKNARFLRSLLESFR